MSKPSHIAAEPEREADASQALESGAAQGSFAAEIQAFVSRPEYSIPRTLSQRCLVGQVVNLSLRPGCPVRKSAQMELSRVRHVDRRLRPALQFMHDNYERELGREEIAATAYLSEYHFARLFKQITGATPHVYLANLRIEKARGLLVETMLPVIEIAAMVGYQSQSHFTKIFKSVTGITPRAYRDSSRRSAS